MKRKFYKAAKMEMSEGRLNNIRFIPVYLRMDSSEIKFLFDDNI